MGGTLNVACAADLYGAETGTVPGVIVNKKGVTTDIAQATESGADFIVKSGIWNYIYGGAVASSGSTVAVTGNIVTTETSARCNDALYGGYSTGSGEVTGNTVIINGATTGDIRGGQGDGLVSGNTVIIKSGTVNGSVHGGYSSGPDSTATENHVVLGDKDNPSGYATITGRLYLNNGKPINTSGSTLTVYNVGNRVKLVFLEKATLNFYINPADMNAMGNNVMLNVTSTIYLEGATINAGVRNVGSVKKGDAITLIRATDALSTDATLKTGKLTDGIMKVDLYIKKDGNSIIATALSDSEASPDEGAKSPVETMAASVTLINSGADAVGAEKATGNIKVMTPFAAVGTSKTRVNSGSHVDMRAWNIAVGFAKEIENKQGKLLFGPIIEYGRGNYDSYLDNGTHGDGKSRFFGIGIIAKQKNHDGLYYEASIRGGRAKSDYNSSFVGAPVNYDTSSNYYGIHLGVGKEVNLKEKNTIDYYAKIFYNHQGGDRANLSNGYEYDFKAVKSLCTRLGLRYTHKLNEQSSLYTGLAWQHEFDSKAKATVINGGTSFDAPAPSVKGATGILELGWKIKPAASNFETGLGFTGSIGKQKGVGFNAMFKWSF